jgi:hypothetical protein
LFSKGGCSAGCGEGKWVSLVGVGFCGLAEVVSEGLLVLTSGFDVELEVEPDAEGNDG